MNYCTLKTSDLSDGPGIRITLFVSGCRNFCKGCQNKNTWSFSAGKLYTKETEDFILDYLSKSFCSGLTLCGGEPFEPENQQTLYELTEKVRTLYPNKSIWCYTGYEYSTLPKTTYTDRLLNNIDILITGRFILEEKDISNNNIWRGSRNQRLVDVKKTLSSNKVIYAEGFPNNS